MWITVSSFFSFATSSVLDLAVNFDINTFTSKRSLQEKESLPTSTREKSW